MPILPFYYSILIFPIAAVIVVIVGTRIISHAEVLAKATGLGQSTFGALFIGAITSLAGLVTSLVVAYDGHASLAVSNCLGGIAVQTTSLCIADFMYSKSNLEHAAASETNLVQGVLLVLLLSIVLIAMSLADYNLFGISPFTVILIISYIVGLHVVSKSFKEPMWRPRMTDKTFNENEANNHHKKMNLKKRWALLVLQALVLSVCGWFIAAAGISISVHAQINESIIGGLLTGVTTSLPELVIAIAAVRSGALNLAVGNIIGGNIFDVLFIAFSDFFYRGGAIYSGIGQDEMFWLGLNITLISILLLGLLRREKYGILNIGFESFLIIVIYIMAIVLKIFII